MTRRRKTIHIDPDQPVIPQLNECFLHCHWCFHCRKRYNCNHEPCSFGFEKLCPPCYAELFQTTVDNRHRRPFDDYARVTDTLLP